MAVRSRHLCSQAMPRFTVLLMWLLSDISTCLENDGSSFGANPRHARELYKLWTDVYGLRSNSTMPPDKLEFPSAGPHSSRMGFNGYVPPAPHLERCASKAEKIGVSETRGPNGELPPWATSSEEGGPQPPWLLLLDRSKATTTATSMTRVVQADIWARQFPADSRAEGTRFLHANWLPVEGHSVGSQLHVMTSLLSLAMASGHVLVPRTGSFERARHEHCSGEGQGTLGCYFWPVTSVACEEQAVHLSTLTPPGGDQLPYVLTVVDSDLPIVSIREGVLGPWHQGTEIAK
eukprot:jgi/Mesen1/6629/ME000034S06077